MKLVLFTHHFHTYLCTHTKMSGNKHEQSNHYVCESPMYSFCTPSWPLHKRPFQWIPWLSIWIIDKQGFWDLPCNCLLYPCWLLDSAANNIHNEYFQPSAHGSCGTCLVWFSLSQAKCILVAMSQLGDGKHQHFERHWSCLGDHRRWRRIWVGIFCHSFL